MGADGRFVVEMLNEQDHKERIAECIRLRAEVEALRSLCAAAYQIVGAADGPLQMMDNLAAAASDLPLPHDPLAGLPWAPNAGIQRPRSGPLE